jgi:hypothetical protein
MWVLVGFYSGISTQVSIKVPTRFYVEFSTRVIFLLIFYFDKILQLDEKTFENKNKNVKFL